MQDWDRLVFIGVGLAVSIYTGIDGYRLWRKRRYLAAAGVALLILMALVMPVLLAMFSA